MADIIDEANQEYDQHLTAAIANRAKPLPLSPICRNGDCGEPSVGKTSYCCSECCADHQKEMWAASQRKLA